MAQQTHRLSTVRVVTPEKRREPSKAILLPWERVPQKALVAFTRNLAVMLNARLPLVQALRTVAGQCKNQRLAQVLDEVRKSVHGGRSLSASLAQHEGVFPPLYVQLTRMGEVAGILDTVLLRLADHAEKTAALRRKIGLALIYPGVILAVALGATVFLLTTIVPTFAEMFAEFGAALPGPTQVILSLSAAVTTHAFAVLVGLLLLILGTMALLRIPQVRYAWDRYKLRLPLIGSLLRRSLMARFCRTLGTLLESGVQLVDGLMLLGQAMGNRYLEQEIGMILKRVRRGSGLYHPLKERTQLFPALVIQMVAVGEETAELDTMLVHAATHYEKEVDGLVESLSSIIEPVLIVFIGLLLGGILIAMYLPMFEMMNAVG